MKQLAMTQNFVWVATDDTESDFLEFRQFKPQKIIKADDIDMECFDYTIIKGYHWNTLTCRTDRIYDLYRVFCQGELIAESEDEVIQLPECNLNYIGVKAYDRLGEDRLVWLWDWVLGIKKT